VTGRDPEMSVSRVFLRPLGSPLTIGMSGLAIASLVQSGLDLHWIASDQTHPVGLILISVPFLLQTIACLFSYLARDGATGATVGVHSGSWLAEGLVHLASVPGSRSGALGLMLLAAGGTIMLSAVAVGSNKPLPGVVFALAASRFIVAGIYELGGGGSWQDAGGLIGLAVVALAGYCVLAFELEGQQHQPALPTFRRGKAKATPHDLAEQLSGLVNEPGVRQTT
jgi:hypothetical protein